LHLQFVRASLAIFEIELLGQAKQTPEPMVVFEEDSGLNLGQRKEAGNVHSCERAVS
jgi:hypothetical protein